MSGKRAKQLRREMLDVGGDLDSRGWRSLKAAWTRTPRPDRRRFSVLDFIGDLRIARRELLEAHLRAMPQGRLERLYDRVVRKGE